MKKRSILKCLLFFGTIFLLNSCEESDDDNLDNSNVWQQNTRLSFSPIEGKETFIWYHDLLTGEDYWGNEIVELDLSLKSQSEAEMFSKVDFYVTVEEEDGYNYTAPFNTDGKLIGSTEIPESGEFTFSLSANDAYGLYMDDFQNKRSDILARTGDIFLLYYVITAKDGSTLDSRESIREGNRFGMKVRVEDYAPPLWAGTFDYEWIEVSSGAETYGGIWLGKTGSITYLNEGEGVFSASNLLWDYGYGGPGKIYYNFLSGLTYVEGVNEETWNILSVDGASMVIAFTYKWTDAYNESGTVRLTRTDDIEWPSNIYTED